MPIGSKILIYSSDAVESEKLIRLLMYQRFVPKAVDSITYATMALVSGEYPIFLCEYSEGDSALFDFLKFMRQDGKARAVIPVVILNKPTHECITDLIKIGCSNFVLQSADQQVLINKMDSVAESIGDVRDKRQFARIDISEYENVQLMITARSGNKYPVRVSNISMGGLQFTWSPDKVAVQKMVVGDVLVNCLLIAKSMDLYTDLKIISVLNYKAGGQFMGLNEDRQATLCNFIYERMLAERIKT